MPLFRFSTITTCVNNLTRRHLEWIYRLTTTRPLLVLLCFALAMLETSWPNARISPSRTGG